MGRRLNGSKTYCKFGDSGMISATNVSHNIVECRAPESNAGYAAVEISHNGVDFSTNGVQFLYVQPATVGNIYPSSGSEKGGTNVTQVEMVSSNWDN